MIDDQGSVTRWIGDLRQGDDDAATFLCKRYFQKLVKLAAERIKSSGKRGPEADEEDAALSAFDSFCQGIAKGRYPDLNDRDELWRLLIVITKRKALDQIQYRCRQKRGSGRIVGESALPGSSSESGDEYASLEQMADGDPSPEFLAMINEQYQALLESLPDEELRTIAVRRMEGYTNDEIAAELDVSLRTVANRLSKIRELWNEHAS